MLPPKCRVSVILFTDQQRILQLCTENEQFKEFQAKMHQKFCSLCDCAAIGWTTFPFGAEILPLWRKSQAGMTTLSANATDCAQRLDFAQQYLQTLVVLMLPFLVCRSIFWRFLSEFLTISGIQTAIGEFQTSSACSVAPCSPPH